MGRKKSDLKRAWSVEDVMTTKHEKFDLSPEWKAAYGEPKTTGLWFIWGNSGNGKSSLVTQLCKEMCRFGQVLYDSLEEGNSDTMQELYIKVGMATEKKKMLLVQETLDELDARLSRPKSPKIIIIDSWQYLFITFERFLAFLRKHPDKLFIVISQADGKMPDGRTARKVMGHAALKIWVEGFKAFSKGRYFGPNGGIYTIWHKGAAEYHGAA